MDVDAEGHLNPKLKQRELNQLAGRSLASVSRALLERNRLTLDDVAWFLPHSGTAGVQAMLAEHLGRATRTHAQQFGGRRQRDDRVHPGLARPLHQAGCAEAGESAFYRRPSGSAGNTARRCTRYERVATLTGPAGARHRRHLGYRGGDRARAAGPANARRRYRAATPSGWAAAARNFGPNFRPILADLALPAARQRAFFGARAGRRKFRAAVDQQRRRVPVREPRSRFRPSGSRACSRST